MRKPRKNHQGWPPSVGPATWLQLISMSFGMGFIRFGMRKTFNPLIFHKIKHEKSIQSITCSLDLAWEVIRFKPCRGEHGAWHALWCSWSFGIRCWWWAWKAWAAATWHELVMRKTSGGMRNSNGETWDLFAWMAKVSSSARGTTVRRHQARPWRRSASASRQAFSAFVSIQILLLCLGGRLVFCWIFFHVSY